MGGFGAFQVGGFSPVSRLSSWTELEGLRWFGMARDCQATFDAVVSVAGYGLGTLEEGERSDLVSGEKCLGLQGFCLSALQVRGHLSQKHESASSSSSTRRFRP